MVKRFRATAVTLPNMEAQSFLNQFFYIKKIPSVAINAIHHAYFPLKIPKLIIDQKEKKIQLFIHLVDHVSNNTHLLYETNTMAWIDIHNLRKTNTNNEARRETYLVVPQALRLYHSGMVLHTQVILGKQQTIRSEIN